MEKLIERFKQLEAKAKYSSDASIAFNPGKLQAEECRSIAIDFAKYILNSEVTTTTCMLTSEKYYPKEYALMQGQLLKDGINMFNKFIEEYYGK